MSALITDRRRAYDLSLVEPSVRDLVARIQERLHGTDASYEADSLR
jgi:hypothetical protein